MTIPTQVGPQTAADSKPITASLDAYAGTYLELVETQAAMRKLAKREEELKAKLQSLSPAATSFTFQGDEVATWDYIDRYSEKTLRELSPHLYDHYRRPVVVQQVDWAALRMGDPDLARQCQTRQFKVKVKA